MSSNFTMNDLFNLIEIIKRKTGLNEQAISERLGYHPGHIAQLKNKGILSPKFLKLLKREFEIENVKEYMQTDPPASFVHESHGEFPDSNSNSFMDIISRLTRTVESQQSTIHVLATGGSLKD